jgi:Protein of unknown function (DUF3489)
MNSITTEPTPPADNAMPAGGNAAPKVRRLRRMARQSDAEGEMPGRDAAAANAPAKPRGESKIARVIALLKRGEGATLAELVEETGWLPHTTRAALTGLKKKGHVIAKSKRGEATCYKIAEAA